MKKFVICREKTCGIYSIRVNTDCSVIRFEIIKSFDTFEEADDYLHNVLLSKKFVLLECNSVGRILLT